MVPEEYIVKTTKMTERWIDKRGRVVYAYDERHRPTKTEWYTYNDAGYLLSSIDTTKGEYVESFEYDDQNRKISHTFYQYGEVSTYNTSYTSFGSLTICPDGELFVCYPNEDEMPMLEWLGHLALTEADTMFTHGGKLYKIVEIELDKV